MKKNKYSFLNIVKQIQPIGIINLTRHINDYLRSEREKKYWSNKSVSEVRTAVKSAVEKISSIPDSSLTDISFLEHQLIPNLGLNHELSFQYPKSLHEYLGRGLHIWQFPNQLAGFLAWIAKNASDTKCYMEIGVRWGGTFIVVSEFIRRICPFASPSIAVDPIEPSPLIRSYVETGRAEYLSLYSTDPEFEAHLLNKSPDFIFIDGDHTLKGVMSDFMLCSPVANTIAFHDIKSDCCPDTTYFWDFGEKHFSGFESFRFDEQYPSVSGNFMGIGVFRKKSSHDFIS